MIGVLVFLRLTGKSQMANLTPLDTVNSVVMGALIGSILYMPDESVWVLVFAIVIWILLNVILRYLLQNTTFNRLLHGKSDFLIKDGEVNLKAIRRNNLGIEQLRAILRENEIYSLRDVSELRFETDGKFTIYRKKNDLDTFLLINAGTILDDALKRSGQNETWLRDKMKTFGFENLKKIYCAEWSPSRGFYIITTDGKIIDRMDKPKKKKPRKRKVIVKNENAEGKTTVKSE